MIEKIVETWKEIVAESRWWTISNLLTLLRIILVPFIVVGIVYHSWTLVFLLFVVAGLTDFFDGYFARWFNEETALGKALDPIADKILLVSSFSALSFIDSPSFSVPLWFVLLLFFRETVILGGSILLVLLGIRLQICPSLAGKLTTFFQLSFIWWLFVCYFMGWNPIKTYSVVILLLAGFSLFSLGQYGLQGFGYLRNAKR